MKELMQQYAAYNCWANNRLFDRIKSMDDQEIRKEVPNSFPSIYSTVVHMLDAEAIWWLRLKMVENIQYTGLSFEGSFDELVKKSMAQSGQWKEWVDHATEYALQHEFIYMTNKKEQFKQPVYQMLQHLFNHATYHRGQLVTLLHQLGKNNIPATDFIVFSRGR